MKNKKTIYGLCILLVAACMLTGVNTVSAGAKDTQKITSDTTPTPRILLTCVKGTVKNNYAYCKTDDGKWYIKGMSSGNTYRWGYNDTLQKNTWIHLGIDTVTFQTNDLEAFLKNSRGYFKS